ncbi:MAG: hypothetical protein ACNA8W_15525 [Bradymonadaceae bacterium]
MKYHAFLLIGFIVFLAACGSDKVGESGTTCTITSHDDGSTTLVCDDGSSFEVPAGTDGTICTVDDHDDGSKTFTCDDGTSVTIDARARSARSLKTRSADPTHATAAVMATHASPS